jgi:hypothetical protein
MRSAVPIEALLSYLTISLGRASIAFAPLAAKSSRSRASSLARPAAAPAPVAATREALFLAWSVVAFAFLATAQHRRLRAVAAEHSASVGGHRFSPRAPRAAPITHA